jgi:hypothetical protein
VARTPARKEQLDVREEARVHLHARRDLGAEYEDEIIESFVEKVERIIDARIEARLEQRRLPARPRSRVSPFAVLGTAMVLGIPLTAIAGGIAGATGMLTVWLSIIFLVLYFDWRR